MLHEGTIEGKAVRPLRGGPVMTVARKVEHLLLCEWFDETGRLHRQTFCPSQLALCERHAWVAVLASLARRYRVAATL